MTTPITRFPIATTDASTFLTQAQAAQAGAEAAAAGISSPYATRADFIAAQIAPVVTRSSFFVGGNTYAVVRDPSGPIVQANGQRWRPDGDVFFGHFGAVGDGVADDTAAINEAFNWLRNQRTGGGRELNEAKLHAGNGRFRITGNGVDAAFIRGKGWSVDFSGAVLLGECVGEIVIDWIGSRWGVVKSLAVEGSATFTPRIGSQIGRWSASSADSLTFDNPRIFGHFSFTSFYNYASEILTLISPTFENLAKGSETFCLVQDGDNTWDIQTRSSYVTVSSGLGLASFNENGVISADFRKSPGEGSGPVVWMSGTSRHRYTSCYGASFDDAVIIISGNNHKQIHLDFHCETKGAPGLLNAIRFVHTGNVDIEGFYYLDHSIHAKDAVFDGTQVTGTVTLRDAEVRLGGLSGGNTLDNGLFNPAAKFSFYGSLHSAAAADVKNLNVMGGTLSGPNASLIEYPTGTQAIFDPATNRHIVKGRVRFLGSTAAVAGADFATTPTIEVGGGYFAMSNNNATCDMVFKATADTSDGDAFARLRVENSGRTTIQTGGGLSAPQSSLRMTQTLIELFVNAAVAYNFAAGGFSPITDGTRNNGTASARWSNTYSTQLRPGAGAVIWTSGAGTPEGAVAAPVGSMFTRTDGGAGTTLYVKESGTGNTGWVAK
jgi:hypothetical protein